MDSHAPEQANDDMEAVIYRDCGCVTTHFFMRCGHGHATVGRETSLCAAHEQPTIDAHVATFGLQPVQLESNA